MREPVCDAASSTRCPCTCGLTARQVKRLDKVQARCVAKGRAGHLLQKLGDQLSALLGAHITPAGNLPLCDGFLQTQYHCFKRLRYIACILCATPAATYLHQVVTLLAFCKLAALHLLPPPACTGNVKRISDCRTDVRPAGAPHCVTYRFTSAAATSVCLASFGLSPSLGFFCAPSAFTLSETSLRFMLTPGQFCEPPALYSNWPNVGLRAPCTAFAANGLPGTQEQLPAAASPAACALWPVAAMLHSRLYLCNFAFTSMGGGLTRPTSKNCPPRTPTALTTQSIESNRKPVP